MPASAQPKLTSSKSKTVVSKARVVNDSTSQSTNLAPRSIARPRKGFQDKNARAAVSSSSTISINTNPNAHPRTDPISALNVLLKLLTSLPSRIGGCQYKFTPAEHALSLHLMSILDPFVFQGARTLASNMTTSHPNGPVSTGLGLIQQPTEIIDVILFHVDSKKDLLNVGLGCKRLHDIVFPRHFDYRVIRCKVSFISVWNHLNHHRSLARNVRTLEILDERAPASLKAGNGIGGGRGMLVPKGIMQGDTDLESTDDELTMHSKQEKFLASALTKMTGLKEFKWSCNHSPISIANVWPTLMIRAVNLKSINICDNLIFAPKGLFGQQDEDSESEQEDQDNEQGGVIARRIASGGLLSCMPPTAMLQMESVVFHSTPHSYGAVKQPELSRISTMLHQCLNLKNLEIVYIAPRAPANTTPLAIIAAAGMNSARTRPLADEFLMYGRWTSLTNVTLVNLRCASSVAPSFFLTSHPALEVLHMDLNIHGSAVGGATLKLPQGSLPRLKEIHASKDIINAILECLPLEGQNPRPLEVLKGFKLSGNFSIPLAPQSIGAASRTVSDSIFLSNLKQFGGGSIKRVEMLGWHDMEDIRKLVSVVPNIHHLDLGRRLGIGNTTVRCPPGASGNNSSSSTTNGPATNMVEWAELLATLPELVIFHGVRFFYEVSSLNTGATTVSPVHYTTNTNSWSDTAMPGNGTTSNHIPASSVHSSSAMAASSAKNHLSMMERSRMRKNDEIAGVLAWKCRKLRRVDHWEEHGNKVIVLLRDDGKERDSKVRWEVRRVKL